MTDGFGQTRNPEKKTDSLVNVLNTMATGDTARIPVLKSLSKILLSKDARQTLYYYDELIGISETNHIPVDPMVFLTKARAYSRIPDNEKALANFKTAMTLAME